MPIRSSGEKWVKLLRAYCPVADNEAMQGEQVDHLSEDLGVPRINFDHPAKELLLECFPMQGGNFKNVVLTGTAGEGKTSLCFELVKKITGKSASGGDGIQTIEMRVGGKNRTITLIYDVTAWRKRSKGILNDQHVAMLNSMAESAFSETDQYYILAVNDGQMHELFRSLPANASDSLRALERELIRLHAHNEQDSGPRLRLINLSLVPSVVVMKLCLEAVLDRPEWSCFENEADKPIFSPISSLFRNYYAINTSATREKLLTLAQIADVSGHHLPTRGVLCLITNALLGHPDAGDGVLRPGKEANTIVASGESEKAALHFNLLGCNLSRSNRQKREVYRFLSMLRIGEETTNDLDELLIFGLRDQTIRAAYDEVVEPDQFHQRCKKFEGLVTRYIRGDINSEQDTEEFLHELSAERRRVFLQANVLLMKKYSLWRTTIFHYADDYLEGIINPLLNSKYPQRIIMLKIVTGLNRIWTGLLVSENANELYLGTGLDLTTSAVSDIHLSQIELDSETPGIEIARGKNGIVPTVKLMANGRSFKFFLSLPRFEFLYRVAEGAMPSSFSRESFTDFMTLKQRCLRDMALRPGTRHLHLMEINSSGTVQKFPIRLGDA